jgi:fructose-1,6-bisphosphatase/inositol monophosphatase family enzyme
MGKYDHERACAIEIARTISKIELSYFGSQVFPQQASPGIDSVVNRYKETFIRAVETEAQEEALTVLKHHFPEHHVCANKPTPALEQFIANPDGNCWLLDTMDGGRNFAEKNDNFGNTVGYRKDGEFVAGVISLPRQGIMYVAVKGEGVSRYSPQAPEGEPCALPDRGTLTAADVVHVGSRVPMGVVTALTAFGDGAIFRYLSNLPTTHRVASMFDGRVKGYIAHQSDIYDMGPVSFVIQEAGGMFVDEDHAPPKWDTVRRDDAERIRLASYGILCAKGCTKQLVDLVKVSIDFSDE